MNVELEIIVHVCCIYLGRFIDWIPRIEIWDFLSILYIFTCVKEENPIRIIMIVIVRIDIDSVGHKGRAFHCSMSFGRFTRCIISMKEKAFSGLDIFIINVVWPPTSCCLMNEKTF